jgi:hypothetical protein
MTDITLALVWIAGGLYELWWFRVRRPKIRARAEQAHAANEVIAYAEGLTKGSVEAQEAMQRWQIRFTPEHVPDYPDNEYWRVTCRCGRRSGQLLEADAKWWAADHLKQHQLDLEA